MLSTTLDAVRSIIKADPSVTPADRNLILEAVRNHGMQTRPEDRSRRFSRVLKRHEVAERLGCSLRFVDKLAQEGILRKRRLPGRVRAVGFLSSEIENLLESDVPNEC